MRRSLLLVVLVITLAGACRVSGPGEGPAVLKIGSLYPETGAQGTGGSEEARGARLAVQWANVHGGVSGRQVELVGVDTPKAEAVPAAMQALQRKGVSVVIGSHGSAISAAAADTATRQDMSFWETGAVGLLGPDVAGGANFFRLAPMGGELGSAAISFVRDKLSAQLPVPDTGLRYAVAYVDDAYGQAVGGGAVDEVTRGGGTLAGTFPYDASKADFGAVAASIGSARPDVLFVAAYLDDGVALRKAVRAANLPLLANIGTSSSYCMPSFGEELGDDAVGLFASDKPDAADVRPDALLPEARKALDWASTHYRADWHTDMSAPALSGFSNAYALLVHVLPAARSTSPADVAAAALSVKLPQGSLANGAGLDIAGSGSNDAGTNRRSASVIWEWVAPRTRAVVWPPAYANHPIVASPTP